MKTFSAVIEGVGGVAAYPFSLTSLTTVKRNGTPSYYALVAPWSAALFQALSDRAGADIRIVEDGDDADYFNLDSVSFARGGRSSSITLSGYRQQTFSSPADWAPSPDQVVRDSQQANGDRVLALVPFVLAVRPGDSLTWDGVAYTVLTVDRQIGQDVNESVTLTL
jgi:hypothetical protein